jgi:ubiquitin C-terminal hydrolase
MNSVLQCILSIKLIRHYFKSNLHQIDLNKRNIFAEGNLAIATSALVKEYNNTKNINIYPRAFKKVINKQIPLFFGYEQHDAQEVRLS